MYRLFILSFFAATSLFAADAKTDADVAEVRVDPANRARVRHDLNHASPYNNRYNNPGVGGAAVPMPVTTYPVNTTIPVQGTQTMPTQMNAMPANQVRQN